MEIYVSDRNEDEKAEAKDEFWELLNNILNNR